MNEATNREPWQDGCVFNPHGVVCKDKNRNCECCGWNPGVERHRREAEATKASKRGGKKT